MNLAKKKNKALPIKKKRKIPILAVILLLAAVPFIIHLICSFVLAPKSDKGNPPEALEKWIETTLISELTPRPQEWYDYWYNDGVAMGEKIWVTGGVTFTTAEYLFKTINFIFYSHDNGNSWQISWRTDQWRETKFFGAGKIKAKNEKEISVILRGPFSAIWILQTTDGGKTWIIKTN